MAEGTITITNNGEIEQPENQAFAGLHTFIKLLIVAILLVNLFHVELYKIIHTWFKDSSWSHGFLIPLYSLYLLNQNARKVKSKVNYIGFPFLLLALFAFIAKSQFFFWIFYFTALMTLSESVIRRFSKKIIFELKPNYLGLVFLIGCILFYPLNIVQFKVGYASALLILPTMLSVILLLGGWKMIKYTWVPVLYLFFAIPMPDRLFKTMTIPMRHWAAAAAVTTLNLVKGLEATASGVIIDVVYKGQRLEPPLDVAEACSGIRLLMAFVALGVAMAYLHYRPIWQRVILLLSTIPIAILCNIIRVTITGMIYIFIGAEYAQGIYHDMLGLMMLPLAFGFYGLLAVFMSNLFVEEKPQTAEEVIIRRKK